MIMPHPLQSQCLPRETRPTCCVCCMYVHVCFSMCSYVVYYIHFLSGITTYQSIICQWTNCFHMFRTLASLILDRKNRVFFLLERCACHIYAQYIIIADIDDVVKG